MDCHCNLDTMTSLVVGSTLSVASARSPSMQARNRLDVKAFASSLPLSHNLSFVKEVEAAAVVTARKSD